MPVIFCFLSSLVMFIHFLYCHFPAFDNACPSTILMSVKTSSSGGWKFLQLNSKGVLVVTFDPDGGTSPIVLKTTVQEVKLGCGSWFSLLLSHSSTDMGAGLAQLTRSLMLLFSRSILLAIACPDAGESARMDIFPLT